MQANLGDRRIAEWLFLLSFVTYGYFYAGAGWNQNSQFDLTRAVVERHTFAIDAYASNTGDRSFHGKHVYANKAPGLALMAVVPYAVVYSVEKIAGVDAKNAGIVGLNCYLCTVAIVATLSALVPALLFLLGRSLGYTAMWSAAVALAIALGTQMLPYSTLMMVHAPSGALMLIALRDRHSARSGIAAALAATMNYICLPVLVVLAVLRRGREIVWFLAGAAFPMLGLALYQWICFGSPATSSVATTDPQFLTKGAVAGVFGPPTLEALYGITFSPYRGLFFFGPVLLMGFVGMFVWLRSGTELWELAAIATIIAVFFGFNVCFNGWEGGFAIGARYLVPIIPLLGVALLRCREWQRYVVIALAVISFGINFTATAVDPEPSGTIPRPLTQYLVPLLVRGEFSRSVPITLPWSPATFTGHTSVNRLAHDEAVVFQRHLPGSPISEWSSFNLGEPFTGAGDLRSLIPILVLLAIGTTLIVRKAAEASSES